MVQPTRRTRRRRSRRNTRQNNNRRNVALYRRPPNISARPRATGLAAAGLSTSISFFIDIKATAESAISGWGKAKGVATYTPLKASTIFAARKDAISKLGTVYSEFRLDRLTVHYIPYLGNTSWGQVAIALHDDQYGYDTVAANFTFDDVVVSPNSKLVKCTSPVGVSWVPTEASDLDFKDPASVLATIMFGCSDLSIEGVFASGPVIIGRMMCVAHLTARSPLQVSSFELEAAEPGDVCVELAMC